MAHAAAYTSITDGPWDDPNTWQNTTTAENPATTVPVAGDTVTGRSADEIDVPGGYDAAASTFSSYTLTIQSTGSLTLSGTLTSRGLTTIESDATLTVNDLDWSSDARLRIHGTFNIAKSRDVRERVGGNEVEVFAGGVLNSESVTFGTRGGDFGIYGSGSTIKMRSFNWAAPDNVNNSQELTFVADAGGFSTIQIAAFNSAGGALNFASTTGTRNLIVDVAALSPVGGESWTLLSYDSISRDSNGDDWHNLSVINAADPNLWSLIVANNAVTLSYIPEPASLALLAMGGLCLAARRRRASERS